jgi:hypothetical protein
MRKRRSRRRSRKRRRKRKVNMYKKIRNVTFVLRP